MKIIIYGTGCRRCKKLHENVLKAMRISDIEAEVIYETNLVKIADKGIMQTPALEINDKVVSTGKVLTEKEILVLLNYE